MINKNKALSNELRKNVILSDLGDSKAKYKVAAIWELLTKKDYTEKCEPIIVTHPDGSSEVYASINMTMKECKIGYYTLKKCIDTGIDDCKGRCYDYLIL